ncbi:lysophospholipase L1 biosynthesis ABC transporter permease [Actinoplanes friuliensis DSM 7358]|uniref:Lysophospholipase L1 biosynthesis ABC transporter permease n=1 Tax=Actinoplanes friuliensis DSM 7358 TaxID=1246995 RepID=U5W5W8_9ACTN|nr:lysophospholipase L1 biosynthesis ABC transporter permease [Actinoplanes friuliensis DSM 7358]
MPTALAVVLAVGFVAGTMIFSDSAEEALVGQYARSARNVDVAVTAGAGSHLGASTLEEVRRADGVAAAAGRMRERLPLLDRQGRLVTAFGETGYGVDAGDRPELRAFELVDGVVPTTGDEMAIDSATATATGYRIGDTALVLDTRERRRPLRVVGVVAVSGGVSTTVLTRGELTRLTGSTGFREIVATLRPGADPATVRDALPAPAGARVRTGDQLRHDLAEQAFAQLSGLSIGLALFAAVAVLVAGFVIANTFTILVAQRQREIALLRCVGAGRGHIFRSVLTESALVGVAGALAGLAVGGGVGWGLMKGSASLGTDIPAGGLVLTPWPIVASLLVGVLGTVVSAAVPAFRATRVPPIAALRLVVPVSGRRSRRVQVLVAVLICVAGTLTTVAGLRTDQPEPAMLLVVAGGIGNFLALLLISPLVIGRLVAALGWLPGRLLGVPARLAVANARRNPGRTAATTAALLVGVALMAGGSTIAATVDRTAEVQLDEAYPVDYLLTGAGGRKGVPAAVGAGLRRDPSFDLVAAVRQTEGKLSGRKITVGSLDPGAIGSAYRPVVTSGRLADFGPGTALVAAGRGTVGKRLSVTADGRTATVEVAAVVQASPLVGDVVLWPGDFTTLGPAARDDSLVMVRTAPGVSPSDGRARLDSALQAHPLVQVDDLASVRAERGDAIRQIVGIIAVLLGFALVIALVGITNTLSLSVLERTRESALVRALGLTRAQLSATLMLEALLMAAAGALAGVLFGVLYGWLTAEAAFGATSALLAVPAGQLAAFVGIAALAGAAAAVLPSRRAGRASVVGA